MSVSQPSSRDWKLDWYACHRRHVTSIIRRQAKVVLLGDSLVANLTRYPSVWDRHLCPFNTVNCGIGGDGTQHVLWQADNYYLLASVSTVLISCCINNMDFYRLPRDLIQQTNNILKTVCWKNDFLFIEQASYWTTGSGMLDQSLFWKDDLHLNKRGCNLFAKSISDAINNIHHQLHLHPYIHLHLHLHRLHNGSLLR